MPQQFVPVPLSFGETVFWFVVGMLISMVFPVVVKTLKSLRKSIGLEALEPHPTLTQRILAAWQQYGGNKYLLFLVAIAVVAMILVLLLQLQFYNLRDAVIAGIGWESLTNKLFVGQQGETKTRQQAEG